MRKNHVSNTYESRFPSRHTMLNPFIHVPLYSINSSSLITHMNQSDWFFAVTDYLLGANRKSCFEQHMIRMDAKGKQMARDG